MPLARRTTTTRRAASASWELQQIDMVQQSYTARYFIQLGIPQGALDSDLVRDLNEDEPAFPADTLRPGANWFMRQIDFPSSLDFQIVTQKVVKMRDDLHLVLKLTGTFFQAMELSNFPFDIQRLSMTIAFNVAKEGIVPIAFSDRPTDGAVLSVNRDMFALSNLWTLPPLVGLRLQNVRLSRDLKSTPLSL